MNILIACEYSGRVREAFRRKGHNAWSCDLLESEDGSKFHIQDDVLGYLEGLPFFTAGGISSRKPWDMMIAHPPCTRLCNSGVRWLAERDLWDDMRDGAEFFLKFLNAPIDKIAVENPIMHKYAKAIVGRGPCFTVQPWQFGDDFKKRTCFWTRGLDPLASTSPLDGSTAKAEVHLASPGPNRWKERSRTYGGIANAMADQWG